MRNSIIIFSFVLISQSLDAATIVYDNGGPNSNGGDRQSDLSTTQSADRVPDLSSSGITTVRFWGSYRTSGTPTEADMFLFRFFSTTSQSVPTIELAPIGLQRSDSGIDSFGADVYEYVAAIPTGTLDTFSGGVFSIVNDTTADANDVWAWHRTSRFSGVAYSRNSDLSSWSTLTDPSEFAFRFEAIPEPGTPVLFLSSVTGLLLRRGAKVRQKNDD